MYPECPHVCFEQHHWWKCHPFRPHLLYLDVYISKALLIPNSRILPPWRLYPFLTLSQGDGGPLAVWALVTHRKVAVTALVASLVMMNRSLLSSAFSCWAEEMAQKAKALFNKSKNLSVILGTHGVDGEARPCQLSSDLHMRPGPSSSRTVTDRKKMKMQQKSFLWMCQGFILSQNQNQMPFSEWNLKE